MEVEERLRQWLDRLDRLTYYQLFGIGLDASDADVHSAFHAFCEVFHPDGHRDLARQDQDAVATIFRRGAEAFDVLRDPGLRRQYDAELTRRRRSTGPAPRMSLSPHSRPPPGADQPASKPPPSHPPGTLEDSVRVPSARPFAQRAEELVREGDYRQAKLHLVLANHRDPENPALETALRELEEYLASQR
jgi:curved DNA-binding protein CbpA